MNIKVYDHSGKVSKEVEVPHFIAEVKVNPSLIQEALQRQQANARKPYAHTLNKGEIRGGGRKPYRQKGTGNARQGSIRNPHYRGGGVAFGPRSNRTFEKDMPRRQRKLALFGALKSRVMEENVFGTMPYEGEPKTKLFATLLAKLPTGRKYLFFSNGDNTLLTRVARNISKVTVRDIKRMNVEDLLRYEKIVFVGDALDALEEVFMKKASEAASGKKE